MLIFLDAWKEMIIIFEDEQRLGEEVWNDTCVTFNEFSAREKRQRAERSYARQYAKTLNGFMESFEQRTIHFRFGRLERGPDYAEPSDVLDDP